MSALERWTETGAGARLPLWVELMAPAIELAGAIQGTDFVPRAMRNNPAAISAAILYGSEIGLGPMQSLGKIAVIEGRPYVAAESQRALVYAAGHDLWLEESTRARATWAGRRAGRDAVTRITWTLDDARTAHIDRKPNWQNYPRQMLSARSSAELVRAIFADVVGGLGALEELDELELVGSNPAGGPDAGAGRNRRSRAPRRSAPAPIAVAPEPELEPAPSTGLSERAFRAEDAERRPPRPRPAGPAPSSVADDPTERRLPPNWPGTPPTPASSSADDVENYYGPIVPRDAGPMTGPQRRRMMALFGELGLGGNTLEARGERMRLVCEWIDRDVQSSNELTTGEASAVIDELVERVAKVADDVDDEPELDPEPDDGPGS